MTGPEEKIARIKEEIIDVPIASYEEAAKFAEGYDLKNRQEELVKLLLKIDSLCRENDIKYSIAYGSNLGAYRYRREGFVVTVSVDEEIFHIADAHEHVPFELDFRVVFKPVFHVCTRQIVPRSGIGNHIFIRTFAILYDHFLMLFD